MTEPEMFEQSFKRPSNYFKLSPELQWEIDEALGILDWTGEDLTPEQHHRFVLHYDSIESSEFPDYELLFCEECFQMTNHLNDKCQKCLHKK